MWQLILKFLNNMLQTKHNVYTQQNVYDLLHYEKEKTVYTVWTQELKWLVNWSIA